MLFKKKDDQKSKSMIAIIKSDQAREQIDFVAAKLTDVETSIKQTDDTLRDATQLVNGSADVVIIEADLSKPESGVVLANLCNYVSQNGSLIVLAENVTSENTRRLFKTGVNDVLELPVSRKELLKSLESAFGESRQRNYSQTLKSAKVISLIKCGGGVGATSLATNLGHILSTGTQKKRKRASDSNIDKVLIIDLDIQFGNVASSLNTDVRTNVLDVRKAEDRMDASLLASTIRQHESGIDILASPDDIIPLSAFSPEFIDRLIGITKAMYDIIIIDLPQAWTEWTNTVLLHSDVVAPVLTPDVEHVRTATKILLGLDNLKVSRANTLLIVNRIPKSLANMDRVSQIKKVTNRELSLVREDTKSHLSARDKGTLLSNVSGSSGTMKNLHQCVEKIRERLQSSGFESQEQPTQDVIHDLGAE